MLSGALSVGMLFSCICVKAEDEVEIMSRRIDSGFSVMSLNTNTAWDIYMKLVEIYKGDLSDVMKFWKFYPVIVKLRNSLKRMPIRDENLMKATYALALCYKAHLEEDNTNYSKAYEKWKKAHKKYRALSDKFKDSQDTRMFEFMATFCECFENVCMKKKSDYDGLYKNYLEELFKRIDKLQESADENSERILLLENYLIYQFLEPLRELLIHEGTMTATSFVERLGKYVWMMWNFREAFNDRCKKSPEFRNKLKKKYEEILKCADSLEKSGNYKLELAYRSIAKILLSFIEGDFERIAAENLAVVFPTVGENT